MLTREELRKLIDILPENEIEYLREHFQQVLDPMQIALALAPDDDEPETEEEALASARARKEIQLGRGIPHEDIVRRHLT